MGHPSGHEGRLDGTFIWSRGRVGGNFLARLRWARQADSVPPLWDESPLPLWSQPRAWLRRDPGIWPPLSAEPGRRPATAARPAGAWPRRPRLPVNSAWFAGTWVAGGIDGPVITAGEWFWMSTAAQVPDVMPRVPASDPGPRDNPRWPRPRWGARGGRRALEGGAFQALHARRRYSPRLRRGCR